MSKTIEKLTITRVAIKDIHTQYGDKQKCGILTKEFGEKWLGHFIKGKYDKTLGLKEGHVVKAMVEQKGEFLNFSMDKMDMLEARIEVLENFMKQPQGIGAMAPKDVEKIFSDELNF